MSHIGDGRTDGRTDRRTDGQTDGLTEVPKKSGKPLVSKKHILLGVIFLFYVFVNQ